MKISMDSLYFSRPRWQRLLLWIFSLLLSASVILGSHLHIVSPYDGLLTENYILPYSWTDLLLFLLLALLILVFVSFLALLLPARRLAALCYDGPVLRARRGRFWALFAFLFLAWLPYLLCYSPGFVFPDTENALMQALHLTPLNNRNPVLFTLFLRLCLTVTGAFSTKDITAGCMLFCILQMLYLSACFSYLICWICTRGRLARWWALVLGAVFGLCPYVAADSVAMWKDPAFSATVVLLSLMLADLALSRGGALNRGWLLRYGLLSLLAAFWRNNGFCALILVLLFLFVLLLRQKQGSAFRRALCHSLCVTAASLIVWAVITVPVYRALSFGTPKEEAAGLQLNQMARVAAYDGNMSEEDRAFLNTMLPLERYKEAYRPCCVDLLKWDGLFNYDALSGSQFLKTWFSLLVKNPRLYFEAWELETYGFWSVNRAEINRSISNISAGAPFNVDGGRLELGGYTLRFRNYLGSSAWAKLLPLNFWSPPIGILNWLVALLALLLLLRGDGRMLLPLAPSIGIALGMLVATPIYYLARYEAAVQFLLPFFLLLFVQKAKTRL